MKTCPYCAEQILEAAILCKHCKSELPKEAVTKEISDVSEFDACTAEPSGFNGVAAVLSFIIPGLGQLYKGSVLPALVWLIAVAIGYMVLIIPGLIIHLACIINASSRGA